MNQDIRVVIRSFIEYNGIKQIHLAGRCNINPQRLSRILRNQRQLSAQELVDICKVLGTTSECMEQFYDSRHK